MKTLGQLLVWGSLAAGALAAATGYLASLDATDQELLGLTLAAPAGGVEQPDGTSQPIADGGQEVTAELLTVLREAGVRNVRVKEFALRRWRGKWYFLLSIVGLLAGAWITRSAARPEAGAEADTGQADSPERTFDTILSAVDGLRSQLPQMGDRSAQLSAIVDRIGQLQKTHMDAFVESRPVLTSLLGLGGYAGLMDTYAAAERQINRAWSAAVDQAYDEATACLDEASTLLEHTRRKLSRTGTAGPQPK